MESYGGLLRQKREEKQLEFETIARDTAITVNYLKALENEDSAVFPGEPYLVGFLKNYSDYLGADTERILQLYHAKILQESPVPEGLIVREKPKYIIPLIVIFGVLLFGAAVTGGILFFQQKFEEQRRLEALNSRDKFKTYELAETPFYGRLYKNDTVVVKTSGGSVVVTVAGTAEKLSLETASGIQHIELSEELEIDVDGDSSADIIVYVSDVSSDSDEDRGAEVKIVLKNGDSVAAGETKTSEIPNIQELPASQKRTVILEDNRAYPFTVRSDFRAGCVFRYKIDRKDIVEDYYSNGDTVNMTASNGLRLWISNGNTVKLQVIANSRSYDLGVAKAGQVIVQDIRWIKDTDGKYKLVVNEIE